MAVVQQTYNRTMPKASAGQIASTTGYDADTKIIETAGGIPFGYAVSRGTDPRGVVIAGTDFVGVTIKDVTLIHDSANVDKYIQKELAGVLVRGDIWVVVEDDVAAGDAVEYSATTGQLGSDGGTAIHDARWMTSATAGGLAILRLGSAAQPKDLTA